MLEHHVTEELARLMDTWQAAYQNAKSISKQIAVLDAQRASLVDKLTDEEEKTRRAEGTINELLADIDDDDTEAQKQIEDIAKEKLVGVFMSEVVGQ